MYEDLVSGSLGSPGLVDAAFNELLRVSSNEALWASIRTAFYNFYRFTCDLILVLGSFIRSTPLVMAVISFFFVGFIVALFMRVYHSA